ncbi:MAG: hypothetical protein A2148_11820 [Chloroflexi bacterium RBG_16_68_14]|nr:MAG: hypothetical protein A2148_11820 [Chloroflexi bacterium RBG_16_68_14]
MAGEVIVWLEEIGKQDVALAGGKGANLGELVRAGIPVPPGFVVTSRCYEEYLECTGLRGELADVLAGLDHRASQALQQASHAAKRRIEATPMPEEFAEAIRQSYDRLGGGRVAVRSSATAEDLAEASFAGQQSSFLNVVGAEWVVEAVRACWASLFEPQAIFYRAENGFEHLSVAIAVPVQSMVQSERSGVMFTVNPVTHDAGRIVIEAVYGLGEAAVSGQVTPDMYIVDKASLAILERSISEQEQKLAYDPAAGGLHPNVWRSVPPDRAGLPKLSDDEVAALARLGLQVEAHYGSPQDIEWAMEGDRLFLLQARPVTTL